jgi:hypothetical protein
MIFRPRWRRVTTPIENALYLAASAFIYDVQAIGRSRALKTQAMRERLRATRKLTTLALTLSQRVTNKPRLLVVAPTMKSTAGQRAAESVRLALAKKRKQVAADVTTSVVA